MYAKSNSQLTLPPLGAVTMRVREHSNVEGVGGSVAQSGGYVLRAETRAGCVRVSDLRGVGKVRLMRADWVAISEEAVRAYH